MDLFHSVKPPGTVADVQKELIANKLMPAIRSKSRLEVQDPNDRAKKSRRAARPIKYTNTHLPELFEGEQPEKID